MIDLLLMSSDSVRITTLSIFRYGSVWIITIQHFRQVTILQFCACNIHVVCKSVICSIYTACSFSCNL